MPRLLTLCLLCLTLCVSCGDSPREDFGNKFEAAFNAYFEEDDTGSSADEILGSIQTLREQLESLDAAALEEAEQALFSKIQEHITNLDRGLQEAIDAEEDVNQPRAQWKDPELHRLIMDSMMDMMFAALELGEDLIGEDFGE